MDIHIKVQANPIAVWFFIGLSALLTLFFAFGGIQQHGSEGWGLILVAIFLGVMTVRIARYYLLPQISITQTHLVIRPFWKRTVKWPLENTTTWEVTSKTIEKDWRSRRFFTPITIEYLSRKDTAGQTKSVVLPKFAGQNEQILTAIAERSGVSVNAL